MHVNCSISQFYEKANEDGAHCQSQVIVEALLFPGRLACHRWQATNGANEGGNVNAYIKY